MQVEIRKYLIDIDTSIDSIDDFVSNIKGIHEFSNNKLVRRAVEREIEIIGEAVNNILRITPNFPLENSRKIVNTRNLVIHAYDSVDEIIIWGIIKKHIPKLKEEVTKLLQSDYNK